MPVFINGTQMSRSHCFYHLVTDVWWHCLNSNMYFLLKCSEWGFHLTLHLKLARIPFSIPTPWIFLTFHCVAFLSLCIYSWKVDAKFCKTCSLSCWDLLCQQSPWSGCFSNKPWKWELIMEILAALYTTGVLACVSVIRNVIRNKRCFWSSISSHEMTGFDFVSLLADGKFQSHCSFLILVTECFLWICFASKY